MGIAVLVPYPGAGRGQVVSTTARPIYSWESDPVPILQEVEWASGLAWVGLGKSRPHCGTNLDHPATSKSLYGLCHCCHSALV